MSVTNGVRLVVVFGMLLAAAASVTSQSVTPTPSCAETQTCAPPRYAVPALKRDEAVVEEKGVAGLAVYVEPAGATGFVAKIENQTDAAVSIVWDESSFVDSNGETRGRLFRSETRKLDIEKSQPPTPIAPHSRLSQVFLAEKSSELEDLETKLANDRVEQDMLERVARMRAAERRLTIGGRIYFAVVTEVSKHSWVGVVTVPGATSAESPR